MNKKVYWGIAITVLLIFIIGSIFISHQNKQKENMNIEQVVNSINDEKVKEIALDLYVYPVYGITVTYEETGEEEPEITNNDENVDDEEIILEIKKLSKLKGDELEEEVRGVVEKILLDNIDNPNIRWEESFVKNYVSKYSPEYIKKIEENKKNQEEFNDTLLDKETE
ncbi:hypothetical protein [Sinanaerobacter sp. ZZT-01]|uniref:hypothetical protein n=1 Tax=Sinanaerobacter sp. ZZT-01 TaxID=3111540 RepID=UPI002D78DCF9|nr:hypothetical protein [Sinanaerobacter sp. ZZT-01]WRR93282.1 hypothetical protein U5921_14815 [Sinanaerobacter sp. ZZT-01]